MSVESTYLPRFECDQVKEALEQHYRLNINEVNELGGYFDQNFKIGLMDGSQLVCKIHDGSEHCEVLDCQNKAMQRLAQKLPDIQFPAPLQTLDGEETVALYSATGVRHFMRLLTYVDGRFLADIDLPSVQLLTKIGASLGRMDYALQDFWHPASRRPHMPWDLQNATKSRALLGYIEDIATRRIVDYFLLQFETNVQPILPTLRHSVVHQDGHRQSVLLDKQRLEVTGIIDFGDTVYTATVCNIAVAAYDAILGREDALQAAAALVRGYHAEYSLTEVELSLLYYLIASRLCIYSAISAYHRAVEPENGHSQSKQSAVAKALKKWMTINPELAHDSFRRACGLPSKLPTERELNMANDRRQAHFPASLYTHYRDPLYLLGGGLQFLYDARGQTYLDCVNNVCQWGHCHPTIVRALQHQAARLNTNSRYLYDLMNHYAERLTATMPEPLNVCFLVNSGSEANDLALRLARAYTDQKDVIVVDKAYHGNSSSCTDISPQRVDRPGKPGLPDHVHKVLAPDTLHGPFSGDNAGQCYADDISRVIEALHDDGRGVSAFIAESLIGTGGQIVLPDGYLSSVYAKVRSAGGVCIADEVQMGFGRVGTHTWCFETQGVVPDIVTMGKPIANGHPMAAVVTSKAIAAAFDGGVTYFNTFGGNPVSCATAIAVLDVLEDECLKDNVVERSNQLLKGLLALQREYQSIGDVRGLGLYIGIELVVDRETLEPATGLAKRVVEQMKAQHVLVNTNGYNNNIIKIKPPLIVDESDINQLLQVFESALATSLADAR